MKTVFDVDSYICDKLAPARPGKVARHKLAYAAHRYAILKTGNPIFDAVCAALPLGPCFLELLHNPERRGNPDELSPETKQLIDEVLQKLGAMSGRALAARSHRNYYEWKIMRSGMHANQVKQNGQYVEIPVSLIRSLPDVQRAGAYVGNDIGLQ